MSSRKPPSGPRHLTVGEFEALVRGGDYASAEFFLRYGQPARLEHGAEVYFNYRCRDGTSRMQVDGEAYYSRQRVVPLAFKRV
jgi:hypothetical protein